jgi:hypothetical protein
MDLIFGQLTVLFAAYLFVYHKIKSRRIYWISLAILIVFTVPAIFSAIKGRNVDELHFFFSILIAFVPSILVIMYYKEISPKVDDTTLITSLLILWYVFFSTEIQLIIPSVIVTPLILIPFIRDGKTARIFAYISYLVILGIVCMLAWSFDTSLLGMSAISMWDLPRFFLLGLIIIFLISCLVPVWNVLLCIGKEETDSAQDIYDWAGKRLKMRSGKRTVLITVATLVILALNWAFRWVDYLLLAQLLILIIPFITENLDKKKIILSSS